MKLTKILCVFLVFVLTFSLFVGCSEDPGTSTTPSLTNIFPEDYFYGDLDPLYTSGKTISTLPETSYAASAGSAGSGLFFYTIKEGDVEKQCVYNTDLNKIVLELSPEDSQKLYLKKHANYDYITASYTTDGKVDSYVLYNPDGSEIARGTNSTVIHCGENLLEFDNMLIHWNGKKYVKLCDIPGHFGSLDTNKTYFVTDSYFIEATQNTTLYYDHNLNYKAGYRAPTYASWTLMTPLENGSLLVQYSVQTDTMATDYDLLQDGKKYDLFAELFNPADSTSTGLTIEDRVVAGVANTAMAPEYADEVNTNVVPNLLIYFKISNRLLDSTPYYAVFQNDGSLGNNLDSYFSIQTGLPERLAPDLYLVETLYGYAALNGNGEVLLQTTEEIERTAYGFLVGDAVYNSNFEEVLNLKKKNSVLQKNSHGILFTELDENNNVLTYLYNKNGTTLVHTQSENTQINCSDDGFYRIITQSEDTSTSYAFYNMEGTLLFTSNVDFALFVAGETSALLCTKGSLTVGWKRLA